MALFQRGIKAASLLRKQTDILLKASVIKPRSLSVSSRIQSLLTCNEQKDRSPLFSVPELQISSSIGTNRILTRGVHSKSEGDQQFLEFLQSEIQTEKNDVLKSAPSVSGFTTAVEGSTVKLTKVINDETITVEFNVNHSVASPDEDVIHDENSPQSEMESRPDFQITLHKAKASKICMQCSFMDSEMQKDMPEDETDTFTIDEVAMVDGEWNDNTYSVSAELLDPNMYDMLMLMLEERGLNHSSFCEQLVDLSTDYERRMYIGMLESMHKYMDTE
ncbi:complement component 1 Q subcomponent-binding protein, mitochondrial-like [Watersipora subatra]|uniref:complement component 1 Q subcomponent-binding protein, mitochondrial-like n=1 Tax=Watersipora subatra TaxID=2589382 RepID=UPI00355C99B5